MIFRVLVIVAAVFWIFWPSLRGDWLWDDTLLIQGNVLTHDPGGWWRIWLEPGRLVDFQPITASAFWLEWQFWGRDTLGYHVVNAALHAVGAILVWRLFVRLGVRAAWLGGLFFAIHPLLVESVAWMAELKNVLSLPPFLLALMAWLDFDALGRARDYRRAFGLFLVALLCKATVIMFPVLILLHAWWRRGRIRRRDIRLSAPFCVLSLLFGALTIYFVHRHDLDRPALPPLGGPFTRLAGAGLVLAFYVEKCLWPAGLLPVYPQWPINPLSPLPWLVWAGAGLVIYGLWLKRRSWGRHALLGVGFFAVNLAPFLGVPASTYMAFTWVMDHIVYIPIIGLIGLAAAAWGELERRLAHPFRLALFAGTAAVAILLAGGAREYARNFLNSETLWTYALHYDPQSWIAHANLGQALEQQGRRAEALAENQQAALLLPHDASVHCNIGKILDDMGRKSEALAEYRQALAIDPRSSIAYCNEGVVFTQQGRLADAIADYEKALEIRPDYPDAQSDLGVALAEKGQWEEAAGHFQAAINLNPEDIVARTNLGEALGQTGHFAEALDQYREVLRLNPQNPEAWYNSGVALTHLGDLPAAMEAYRAALRLNPAYANARRNLAELEAFSAGH